MKASEFRRSDALLVRYRKPREGPASYLVYEPGKSFICMTSKDVLKAVACVRKLFPLSAELVGSTYDAFVASLLSSPNGTRNLPVLTEEMGDTW